MVVDDEDGVHSLDVYEPFHVGGKKVRLSSSESMLERPLKILNKDGDCIHFALGKKLKNKMKRHECH